MAQLPEFPPTTFETIRYVGFIVATVVLLLVGAGLADQRWNQQDVVDRISLNIMQNTCLLRQNQLDGARHEREFILALGPEAGHKDRLTRIEERIHELQILANECEKRWLR